MAGFSSAIVVAAVGLVGFAHAAAAQAIPQGFAYGGPTALIEGGDAGKLAAFGAGGDFLARNGAGGSVEIGRLGIDGSWVNQLSVNAMYQKPPSAKSRVSPFVSGGYSAFFNTYGGAHGFNVGGGANIWLYPRLAIRLEVRDHILPSEGAAQALAFRFGVTFR